jgi:ubiquinone biosynthesis protein
MLNIIVVIFILIKEGVLFSIFVVLLNRRREIEKYHNSLIKLGKNLLSALPQLGPAFVKLGQFISTRHDIVDPILCDELRNLQDSAPKVPFKQIKKTLISELGDSYKLLKFDDEPIAAASIAQVHKAYVFVDGVECKLAVKVLRPGVSRKFKRNINLMMCVAKLMHRFIAPAKCLRLKEVVNVIADTAASEVNMQIEAAAADKLRHNSEKQGRIYIPKVFWQFTTKSILVTEWIDGSKLDSCDKDIKVEIAKKLAFAFFQQAYVDGFFHGDIHQGNILIDKRGNIVLLDFGMFSYLPSTERVFIAEMIYAFIKKDYDRVAELHFKAGYLAKPKTGEEQERLSNMFALACRTIAEPIFGQATHDVSISRFLKKLFEVTSEFNIRTQPQLILLQKNTMALEGILASLDPSNNMWSIIEPWFTEWARANLNVKSLLKRRLDGLLKVIEKLEDKILNGDE